LSGILLVALVNVSPANASAKMLDRFFSEVTTLEAHFDQKVFDETGFTLEESSGTFYLSRPGQFRWDYKSLDEDIEQGQQIVANGESIFMYDPDLDQVTQRSLDDALNQIPSLLLVQTGTNVDEHFIVNELGVVNGLSWVGLKPKDENAGYKQLMIGFLGEELNMITLLDGLGNETRLSLTAVKDNLELPSDVFNFVVPEGADVYSE